MSAIPAIHLDPESRAEGLAPVIGVNFRAVAFPLIVRTARRLSDDELLELRGSNDGVRIERTAAGDLLMMTPVGGRTGNQEGYLFRELDLWVEREGRGIAFSSNTGFSLPDGSMRAPDAAWLSTQKWERLDLEQRRKYIPFCPEFVIELRSPTDRVPDMDSRMREWLAIGAELGWMIDPIRKLAMVYRPEREPETLLRPEYLEGEGPVAGFRLRMQRLWE